MTVDSKRSLYVRTARPELSLPPELGTLPAPTPGAAPTQAPDVAQEGENALAPQQAIGAPANGPSAGEQALLSEAGPTPPPGIRAAVNQNALIQSRSPGVGAHLEGQGASQDQVVDADAEARRLQQNEALGAPVTQGATPQENANGQTGFWHRLLNFF